MTLDNVLSVLGIILVPFAWFSAVILARAAKTPPRVGALTERTWIAVAIAIMLSSGALITVNRLVGYSLFPIEVARVVFLVSLLVLGAVPVAWVYLWFQGRLGQSDA